MLCLTSLWQWLCSFWAKAFLAFVLEMFFFQLSPLLDYCLLRLSVIIHSLCFVVFSPRPPHMWSSKQRSGAPTPHFLSTLLSCLAVSPFPSLRGYPWTALSPECCWDVQCSILLFDFWPGGVSSFSLNFPTRGWWLEAASPPILGLTSSMAHLLLTQMWSIWFSIAWSGDT